MNKILLLIWAIFFCITSTAQESTYTFIKDTFDKEKDIWEANAKQGIHKKIITHSQRKCLQLSCKGPAKGYFRRHFPIQRKNLTVEFRFYSTSGVKYYLTDYYGRPAVHWKVKQSNLFLFYESYQRSKKVATKITGKWIKIKIELDISKQTYNFYIGNHLERNVPFIKIDGSKATSISKFRIKLDSFPSEVLVDDFTVSTVVYEPSITSMPFSSFKPTSRRLDQYYNVVKEYVDTMIAKGKDLYGAKSNVFLSVLRRDNYKTYSQKPIRSFSITEHHRVGAKGANLGHDLELYEILYKLHKITAKQKYLKAANKGLKDTLNRIQNNTTKLWGWGEHLYYDTQSDTVKSCYVDAGMHEHYYHEIWDSISDVIYKGLINANAKRVHDFAYGLWHFQIDNQTTGNFSRHGEWKHKKTKSNWDFPRCAGYYIFFWGKCYAAQKNPTMRTAIDVLLKRFEQKIKLSKHNLIQADSGRDKDQCWTMQQIVLAFEISRVIQDVDKKLQTRIEALANKCDQGFLHLPHFSKGKGFINTADIKTGQPKERGSIPSAAGMARYIYKRYLQLENGPEKAKYRHLLLKTADVLLNYKLKENKDYRASIFANIIQLNIVAYKLSGQKKYLQQAEFYCDYVLVRFWGKSKLPKASLFREQYESICGTDNLAKALLHFYCCKKGMNFSW